MTDASTNIVAAAAIERLLRGVTSKFDEFAREIGGIARAVGKQSSTFAGSFETLDEVIKSFTKDTDQYQKQLRKSTLLVTRGSEEQINQLTRLFEARKRVEENIVHLTEKSGEAGQEGLKKAQEELGKFTTEIQKREEELKKITFKKSLDSLGAGLGGLITRFGKFFTYLSAFNAAELMYQSVKKEMATGISLGLKDYFQTGFQLGLKPEEYVDLVAANRQAVLAAGGLAKNFDILSEGQAKYFGYIGEIGDVTRYTQEQMSILTRAGIRPTIADVSLLGNSFIRLTKLTGLRGAELNAVLADVIEDESSVAMLRAAATQDERRAIILGTAKRLEENAVMGMSIEQNKAAIKTINKLAGAFAPTDRIKQAAQFRAFGAAMGISGTEEASRTIIAGKSRVSTEAWSQLTKVATEMANVVAESGGTKYGVEQEIAIRALVKGLNLDPFLGEGSALVTTTAKTIAPQEAAVAALGTVSKNTQNTVEGIQRLSTFLETTFAPLAPWILALTGKEGNLVSYYADKMVGLGEKGGPQTLAEKFGEPNKAAVREMLGQPLSKRQQAIEDINKPASEEMLKHLKEISEQSKIRNDLAQQHMNLDKEIGKGQQVGEEQSRDAAKLDARARSINGTANNWNETGN